LSDAELKTKIQEVWLKNNSVYGVRKVWRQLLRDKVQVARCTVQRLMREMGLRGIIRGKPVRTTVRNPALPCPQDRVKRKFFASRPNELWVSDFTYVSTAQGFAYVAFIIDVFARMIVGWSVSTSPTTHFVLDALEQALHSRGRSSETLIHHSDRGSQYLSIRYTERLLEFAILPSVGTVGDSFDNALAETINGLYKAEVIHRGTWKTSRQLELATLTWVNWFNNERLLGPIGFVPPAEAERNYYDQLQAAEAA